MFSADSLFVDILPIENGRSKRSKSNGSNTPTGLARIITSYRQYDADEIMTKIKKLYVLENPSLRWRTNLDKATILDAMTEADKKPTLRLKLKELRKVLTMPIIKGGKNNNNSMTIYKAALTAHEDLVWSNGTEPTVTEVAAHLYKSLGGSIEVYDYSLNNEIDSATPLDFFVSAFIDMLQDASGGTIMNKREMRATRDWLCNIEIDNCLAKMRRQYGAGRNIILIPTWLSSNIDIFLDVVAKSIANDGNKDLIIFITNTAVRLPGEHWFLVAYDAARRTMIYYDSVNINLYHHVFDPVKEFALNNKLELEVSFAISQGGDAECGVYCLAKAQMLMQGDNDSMMYVSIPDDVIYNYRNTLQDMLNT